MDPDAVTQSQILICQRYGQEFFAAPPDSLLGFALQTVGKLPIHGLRHPPEEDTNGWYIWMGEFSDADDFFSPLHTVHLLEKLPEASKYLGLPPGYRFLLAPDYVDVWFDSDLLNI